VGQALRRSAVWLGVAFLLVAPRAAAAQTLKLTVHVTGNTPGGVTMVSGGLGTCLSAAGTCTFDVDTGATVRIVATGQGSSQPGRFSGGTGPAAGCTLSTCSFTMTAAADLTATFTSGDGPVATMTVNGFGGGLGLVMVDGVDCHGFFSCASRYLQGSLVHLEASGAAGAVFSGYSTPPAGCSVESPVCDFALTGNTATTANIKILSSVAVTPSSATGVPGGPPQQFTATGFFTGGSLPVTGKGLWSSGINLPFHRKFLAADALGGKIYALGGTDGGGTSAASDVAAYTPGATAHWDVVASLLTPRAFPAAVAAGGLLYAIGGNDDSGLATASVERYDPVQNMWTPRAPMASPRYGLVAGVIDGVIYAAGGTNGSGTAVATLEAYDPATNTWTPKASMPAARGLVAGGVIGGILYVVGGTDGASSSAKVQAYDPATNTWTTKASMPAPLSGAASAVADGVLYVFLALPGFIQIPNSVLFAYDPVADAWTVKASPGFRGGGRAAAALDGFVYAIGGTEGDGSIVSSAVDSYIDALRWTLGTPAVARITQGGSVTGRAAGTTSVVATAGTLTCGANCGSFTVSPLPPTDLTVDSPANGSVLTAPITVGGWALNRGAPSASGTGVDAVHVYAFPSGGGAGIFVGAATYGLSRPDVGALFGSQFTNSGFSLTGGASLAAGGYMLAIYGRNAMTTTFDVVRTVNITIAAPVSQPFIDLDSPRDGFVVNSSFEVGGWALDAGAPTGTGVDAVQFYIFPNDGASPGVFIGQGSYGLSRPDVGAIFGSPRYDNTGFHYTISGLGPGAYVLGVYARSTVTGTFSIIKQVHITVNATALMAVNPPVPESIITAPIVDVDGWSIDRSIESTALSGSGVDTLHVYAYPNPGSGAPPIFLGVATVGLSRPDVAALYGSRYGTSGFHLAVDRSALGLAPGVYNIVVHSHSTVTNTFNNLTVVRVTLQ